MCAVVKKGLFPILIPIRPLPFWGILFHPGIQRNNLREYLLHSPKIFKIDNIELPI